MTRLFTLVLVLGVFVTGYASVLAQKGKTPAKSSTPKVATTNKPSTTKQSTAVVANPALKSLSIYEKQLLDEINYARANPHEYVKALELFKRNFRGKEIHYPEGGVLVTNEGVVALDEAISFLRKLKPLPALEVRGGMVKAAKAHADDLVSSGKSGHLGSDGSQPGQ
ncbi:MAG TPA: hypothetical protein VIT88_09805, partial [Pyrinomonadaceae bacterium]